MANSSLILLCAVIAAAAVVAHGYAPPAPKNPTPEKTVDVVVEGMVYCQSCKYQGTWSLSEAKPIALAKISVICKNYFRHVSYYKVFETDANGYFYGELNGYKINHALLDHPLQACAVKLVSSPLEDCSLPSNINYGMYGSKLRYQKKRLVTRSYDAAIYSAGPLAFRPSNCTPPAKYDESETQQ